MDMDSKSARFQEHHSSSLLPSPTFVQADTSSFKQVVQMLTGSSQTLKQSQSTSTSTSTTSNPTIYQSSKTHLPPIKTIPRKQQSGFELYERRNLFRNLKIKTFAPNSSGFSPRNQDILSPSILHFPALVLSPMTPLIPDPFDRSTVSNPDCNAIDEEEEEKAIKDKGFFLHPSAATTLRKSEPRLLPLFPTTSPRATGSPPT